MSKAILEPTKTRASSAKKEATFESLLEFDQDFLNARKLETDTLLVGLDEVGRGSLIGPVVAAAAAFKDRGFAKTSQELLSLNDSKKLTPTLREELYNVLYHHCWVGIGEASQEEVDTLNIHHASLLAMERALQALLETYEGQGALTLILDGRWKLPNIPKEIQHTFVKGDGRSASIAAASVIAKHYRDSMVIELAQTYPGYDWQNNMGYGTPKHLSAIASLGLTPLHRRSFKSCQI